MCKAGWTTTLGSQERENPEIFRDPSSRCPILGLAPTETSKLSCRGVTSELREVPQERGPQGGGQTISAFAFPGLLLPGLNLPGPYFPQVYNVTFW